MFSERRPHASDDNDDDNDMDVDGDERDLYNDDSCYQIAIINLSENIWILYVTHLIYYTHLVYYLNKLWNILSDWKNILMVRYTWGRNEYRKWRLYSLPRSAILCQTGIIL